MSGASFIWDDVKCGLAVVAGFVGVAGFFAALAALATVPVYLGWNYAVVPLFGMHPCTFSQGFFLMLTLSALKSLVTVTVTGKVAT